MSGSTSEAWALGQQATKRYDRCIGRRSGGPGRGFDGVPSWKSALPRDAAKPRPGQTSPWQFERAERGCRDEVALQTLLNICLGGPQ